MKESKEVFWGCGCWCVKGGEVIIILLQYIGPVRDPRRDPREKAMECFHGGRYTGKKRKKLVQFSKQTCHCKESEVHGTKNQVSAS